MGAVAVGTLGMASHCRVRFGQDLTASVNITFIEAWMTVVLGEILADVAGFGLSELKGTRRGTGRAMAGKALVRTAAIAEIETDMAGGTTHGQVFTVHVGRNCGGMRPQSRDLENHQTKHESYYHKTRLS